MGGRTSPEGRAFSSAEKEAVQSWRGRRNSQHHKLAAVADGDCSLEPAADFSVFFLFFVEPEVYHICVAEGMKNEVGGCGYVRVRSDARCTENLQKACTIGGEPCRQKQVGNGQEQMPCRKLQKWLCCGLCSHRTRFLR